MTAARKATLICLYFILIFFHLNPGVIAIQKKDIRKNTRIPPERIFRIAKPERSVHSDTLAGSILLDISPRRQWGNANGYCGACSIQQAAAYYGSYVSQSQCRRIVDSSLRTEILIGVNEHLVLDASALTFEQWDHTKKNNWKEYLVWIKKHLLNHSPVLFASYMQGGGDPDYDHIMVAVGINSSSKEKYLGDDELIFNDNFKAFHLFRTFRSWPDNRYIYFLPTKYNFGCAVTNIQDEEGITLPVHLSIDSWEEPNVTRGASPSLMTGTIRITSLTAGKSYVLLRYDDLTKVPSKDFHESSFRSSIPFKASGIIREFNVTFMSDGIAVFRCVPAPEHTLSGRVTMNHKSGTIWLKVGLSNVQMTGLSGTPKTDSNGFYQARIPESWSGGIIPAKEHYTFNPSVRKFTEVTADIKDQDFNGTRMIDPPLYFYGRQVLNRSLAQAEYIHILTWQPNPGNINIEKYRIYADDGQLKGLLAEMNKSVFEYRHRNIHKNRIYTYSLAAVDDQGREGSPAVITLH